MSEDELRMAVLKIDLLLKRRQAIWEIPKALAALAAAAAIFMGFVLAGINRSIHQARHPSKSPRQSISINRLP